MDPMGKDRCKLISSFWRVELSAMGDWHLVGPNIPAEIYPKASSRSLKALASTMYFQICQHSALCYAFFPQRVRIVQPELIIVMVKFQLVVKPLAWEIQTVSWNGLPPFSRSVSRIPCVSSRYATSPHRGRHGRLTSTMGPWVRKTTFQIIAGNSHWIQHTRAHGLERDCLDSHGCQKGLWHSGNKFRNCLGHV